MEHRSFKKEPILYVYIKRKTKTKNRRKYCLKHLIPNRKVIMSKKLGKIMSKTHASILIKQ